VLISALLKRACERLIQRSKDIFSRRAWRVWNGKATNDAHNAEICDD
jgi:hypothetical protein